MPNNAYRLLYASDNLKNETDCFVLAIKQHPETFQYASSALKNNPYIALTVAKNIKDYRSFSSSLKYASNN